MKVIIDTNFLLIPYKFKVDIFTEIDNLVQNAEFFIIDSTLSELSSITSGEDKLAAKLALQLLEKHRIQQIKSIADVDTSILHYSDSNTYVCTMDNELKKRLIAKNVPIISLRQKNHLEIL